MAEHLPATAQDRTGRSRGLLDWRSLRFGVLGACAILFVTACAGYRLGPPSGLAAREKTVYVAPFVNKTLEPRLSEAVTQALRKRLSQEGTFRLVTRGAADIVVSGTLTKYDRQAVAYEYGDVITARDFEAFATAHVVAKPATGGAPLVDCEVRGRATFRIGADQTTSERLALPALADDLARRVAALLTDGTW